MSLVLFAEVSKEVKDVFLRKVDAKVTVAAITKGRRRKLSDTSFRVRFAGPAWRGGLSSDVFPGFVLPLTARRGQNEKLLSWSFFLRALKVLQKGEKKITLTFCEQMSAKGA